MDEPLMHEIPEEKGNIIKFGTDFQRICRTCLAERDDLQSVFNGRVNELLMSFASIHIVCNDGLPSNICSRCLSNISLAYNFKQQAENSDYTLRQFIDTLHSTEEFCVPVTTSSSITIEIPSSYDNNSLHNSNVSEEYSIQSNDTSQALSIENTSSRLIEEKILKNESYISDNLMCGSIDMSYTEDLKTKAWFQCCNCHIVFEDTKLLQNHKCPYLRLNEQEATQCGKSFVENASLIGPMKRRNEEKKHRCDQCGKRFFVLKNLVKHKKDEHREITPLCCNICNKKFADPRVLSKHIKRHTEWKKIACHTCRKRFSLTVPKTSEKPFDCDVCGYAFSTSFQLVTHMKSHLNEKPYFCKLCPKNVKVKCIVLNCKGLPPGGLIHHLPKRPELRKIWLDRINRPELMSQPRSTREGVCSKHFAASSYKHATSRFLSFGTVPLSSSDKNIREPISEEDETIVECKNTAPELCADIVLAKTKRTYTARRKNTLQTII